MALEVQADCGMLSKAFMNVTLTSQYPTVTTTVPAVGTEETTVTAPDVTDETFPLTVVHVIAATTVKKEMPTFSVTQGLTSGTLIMNLTGVTYPLVCLVVTSMFLVLLVTELQVGLA